MRENVMKELTFVSKHRAARWERSIEETAVMRTIILLGLGSLLFIGVAPASAQTALLNVDNPAHLRRRHEINTTS
jgi:hypothetical protein